MTISEIYKVKYIGFTSTSTEYATSFAKYQNYDTILEIFAPKGTQVLNVSEFSDYGDVENEFLLKSIKMFIYDVNPNIIDENNNKKVLLKCVAVSQDKSFYKSNEKEQIQQL